jgi:multidrug resistance efflux pump
MSRALAFALLALLPQDPPKPPADKPPAPEELHEVRRGTIAPTIELEATFESPEAVEIRLRPESFSGELKVLKVAAAGEAVKHGTIVLAIDPDPLEKLVAAAENDLRVARSALVRAEADAKIGEKSDAQSLAMSTDAVRNAETALKVFETVEGPQMITQVELMTKARRDAVSDQEEELAQLEKMYKSEELTNATAEIVVRRAKRTLGRSRIWLKMAEEDEKVAREVTHPQRLKTFQYSVETARRSLESLKVAQAHGKVSREAELFRSRTSAEQAEERVAKLRKDLEGLTIRSPLDGRVFYGQYAQGAWTTADQVAPSLRPGERVMAGQVLMTVCGAAGRARAILAEASYFDVAAGQAASIVPTALPDAKVEGRVTAKAAASAARGVAAGFEVKLELREPHAEILPGMKGKATVSAAPLKDVVIVPSGAIASSGGKSTVKVSKDGKTEAREVKPGKSDGKMTEIRSGLEPGEKIVAPK